MNTKNIKIDQPMVSANWLYRNKDATNLVVIDATMKHITWEKNKFENEHIQIKSARYLDIKTVFSDVSAPFPNTMLSAKNFQEKARRLGINKDTAIIVYDAIGIYTSPRVWWMFKSMGHENIAVLNGGFPAWIKAGYSVEKTINFTIKSGDFEANFNETYFNSYTQVLTAINSDTVILDARSEDRFNGTKDEPRKGLRKGHIPSSKSLHYQDLLDGNLLKSVQKLSESFALKTKKDDDIIFSCGSGITACILALGATISGHKKISVYDGSWTEWGSLIHLPIAK